MIPSTARQLRRVASSQVRWGGPALLLGLLLVVFIPAPAGLLDLLLTANITISVLALLNAISVRSPLEFSVFPSLLLTTALARVVLNFASTRLILTNAASEGAGAAGDVIAAFGAFVAGGDPAVGGILFLILVVIQFVVITRGATRIGEVAARFALDGLPGRQAAIDADFAQGLLSSDEVQVRRRRVAAEVDYYGAMDGAAKFVRGDAVAGLVITVVNIVGGLAIGVLSDGLPLAEAARLYTVLTVGDGLVSQLPALLISIAAGLLMTRTSGDSDLPRDSVLQLVNHRESMFLAAGFLAVLSATGLPAAPLLLVAAVCGVLGWLAPARPAGQGHAREGSDSAAGSSAPTQNSPGTRNPRHAAPANGQASPPTASSSPSPATGPRSSPKATASGSPAAPGFNPVSALHVEPLELELGQGLLRLAMQESGGSLLARVAQLRQSIAQELGLILPGVRIQDNLQLDPRQYQIRLRGAPVAVGEAYADALLAVDDGGASGRLPGIEAADPVTGRPARWIETSQRDDARALGYRLVEPESVLIRRLAAVVRTHADELLTRQQVHELLEHLRLQSPHLVDELAPAGLSTAVVHRVLCGLLRERTPIRDLEVIVEALGTGGSTDPVVLIEHVRHALRRTICRQYRDDAGVLRAVVLAPAYEERLAKLAERDAAQAPRRRRRSPVAEELKPLAEALLQQVALGRPPVVVCGSELRSRLRAALAAALPQIAVLSRSELTHDTELDAAAVVASPVLETQAA